MLTDENVMPNYLGKKRLRIYVTHHIGIDELTALLATQIYFFDCIDLDKIENLDDADEMVSWLQKISRKDLEKKLRYILRYEGVDYLSSIFPDFPLSEREKFIEGCRAKALELFPEFKNT